MKLIKILIWLLLPLSGLAQIKPDFTRTPNGGNTIVDWNVKFKTLILPKWMPGLPPLYQGRDTIGGVFVSTDPADKHLYVKQNDGAYKAIANLADTLSTLATHQQLASAMAAVAAPVISGFTVTHIPQLNEAIAGGTPDEVIRHLYNQTQTPTAGLSGGFSYERHAAGTFSANLSWAYGKQANTAHIASAGISGNGSSYNILAAQPGANASITGVQTVTGIPYNSTLTYTNTVVTDAADGSKTAAASTQFSVYDKRYAGFDGNALISGVPAQADILASYFQDNNGSTIPLNGTTGMVFPQQPADAFFYYITKLPISNIKLNGFPSNELFNMNVPISFINANTGTFNGYITISKSPFGSTAPTTVITD